MQKLGVKIKVESVSVNTLFNIENIFGFLLSCIDLSYIVLPLLQIMLLSGSQSILETVTHLFEPSTLM
jgi:hypothetical protein